MVINLVERFRQINSAEISCKALRHPTISNSTNSINNVRTAFLGPKLIIVLSLK